MYCKKCGNPVDETDVWCSMCGTRLKEEPPAEEEKPVRHTEFNWNVHDFSTPKRPEELRMHWTLPQSELLAQSATQSGQPEVQSVQPETAQAVSRASGIAPEKEAEATAVREESVKENEKYFTFSKRNEDFQRLLDQEYEKLSNSAEGESCTPPVMSTWHGEDFRQRDRAVAQNDLERMIFEEPMPAPDEEPKPELTPTVEETPKAAPEAAEESAPAPEPIPAPVEQEEPKAEEPPVLELLRHGRDPLEELKTANTESKADPIAQQLEELKKTTESFYQQLVKEREALQLAEQEAARRAGVEKELAQWQEKSRSDAAGRKSDSLDTEIKVTVAVKSNGKTAYSETVSPELAKPEQPKAQSEPEPIEPKQTQPEPKSSLSDTIRITKGETIQTQDVQTAQPDPNSETETIPELSNAAAELPSQDTETVPVPAPHIADAGWHENTLNNFFTPEQDEQEQGVQKEKPKKSGTVGKVILAIIAILLAVEIVALGIRYFAPESSAALVVENAQMQLVQMVDNAVNYIKGITG